MTHAVILAGGWGERLWPMSTRARPKQLLSLTGESTLVGNTLLRIAPLVSVPDVLVMTSAALKDRMAEELSSIPAHRIIGEPEGKNTAAIDDMLMIRPPSPPALIFAIQACVR